MKQRKLRDYPSEVVKRNPNETVIRPPRRYEERIIIYKPKHREIPEVRVVSKEQMDEAKEMRRRGIEYHQMRSRR